MADDAPVEWIIDNDTIPNVLVTVQQTASCQLYGLDKFTEHLAQTLKTKGETNMKIRKSDKYKNYGPAPRNEYTNDNTENNINPVAVLELATQEDDTMYKQHLPKLRVQYQPRHGWKRPWKANGWRAELASRQDGSIGARRYNNARRTSVKNI